ncbi:MAG: hypothetical protein HQK88_17045 [Nitrospirae bacterium]|nr:hypothetical protein [Nitrospirota bacterium]MBF0534091.1 hypothetical protein [Nitrospirota bacterium]MBF0618508.1 hypothetical protein [Nitrospirota bacterium]
MFSKKAYFIYFIVWGILIVVLSHLLAGSFNPIKVFHSQNVLAKIVIGFMFFPWAGTLIQLFIMSTSYADLICPVCEKNLVKFVPVYGRAKTCFGCLKAGRNTQYHDKCFKAKGRCPICEQENPWEL